MTDLKPCPFCGGEAYYSYIGDGIWKVRCFYCGAEVVKRMYLKYDTDGMKKARDEVIEKWNKRMVE